MMHGVSVQAVFRLLQISEVQEYGAVRKPAGHEDHEEHIEMNLNGVGCLKQEAWLAVRQKITCLEYLI